MGNSTNRAGFRFLRRAGAVAVIGVLAASCSGTPPETVGGIGLATTGDGPGVSSAEVKVGFILLDYSGMPADQQLAPSVEVQTGQLEAFVERVNSTGGIAGRDLVPVIKPFDVAADSPETEEALCREFTQEESVFAVVMSGMYQSSTRGCYATAGTVMIDSSMYPVDERTYSDLAPYLWAPSTPSVDELARNLPAALTATGWYGSNAKVAVLALESDGNRRAFTNDLQPAVEVGSNNQIIDQEWVSPGSDNRDAELLEAANRFRDGGVTHVLMMGGGMVAPDFLNAAEEADFHPKYAFTSLDAPDYAIAEHSEALVGSAGLSFSPVDFLSEPDLTAEILSAPIPHPGSYEEDLCTDGLTSAGLTWNGRQAAAAAFSFCDAALFLQEGLAGVEGTLNADTFADGVSAMASSYQTSLGYGTFFERDRYTGANEYRLMWFDGRCKCFTTMGDVIRFDG